MKTSKWINDRPFLMSEEVTAVVGLCWVVELLAPCSIIVAGRGATTLRAADEFTTEMRGTRCCRSSARILVPELSGHLIYDRGC